MPHVGDQNSTLPLDWHNGTCLFHSLLFTVVKECTKQAAVEVIQDGDEEELIKLKGSGKLRTHYKDSHSEFQKHQYPFHGYSYS